jgi:RNA polymerase sigma-70 factor (ECF subfamily)
VSSTVQRAQAGDAEAFRSLYDEHSGRVFALCFRMSGDRQQAEDLVQTVFIRVWERLETFRGESAFSTWLHRLAVNEVLGARRSSGRRERRVVATDDPESLEPVKVTRTPHPPLELEHAIAELPDGARSVFVLHDIEGYQHEEIAGMMGIAPGTSKAQLHRARRLLREALQ